MNVFDLHKIKWITLLIITQFSFLFTASVFAASNVKVTSGKITGISRKAQTISLSLKDGSFLTVKYNDATKYINAKSYKYLRTKDAIKVQYKTVKGENTAVSVERKLVKMPAGVTAITTKELGKLVAGKQKFKLIDARPVAMYEQSHIPGAISVPYSKLQKVGQKLLPFPKNELLIFYCGGDT